MISQYVNDDKDSLTGHSFRSGLATLMEAAGMSFYKGFVVRFPFGIGMSKEDIKAWGRWSSEAYLRYCKEGRPKCQVWSMLHNILLEQARVHVA